MAVYPGRLYVVTGKGFPVCGRDLLVRNTELAGRKSGRDLRMRRDVKSRIYPECNLHRFSCCPRNSVKLMKFVKRIDRDLHFSLYGKLQVVRCLGTSIEKEFFR